MQKVTTTAGFEPTRLTSIDFESIALTTRPSSLSHNSDKLIF